MYPVKERGVTIFVYMKVISKKLFLKMTRSNDVLKSNIILTGIVEQEVTKQLAHTLPKFHMKLAAVARAR